MTRHANEIVSRLWLAMLWKGMAISMKTTIRSKFISNWLPPLVILVLLIGTLELFTTGLKMINEFVIPSPSSILWDTIAFFNLRVGDFSSTMYNTLIGYVISVPVGIVLAGVLAQSKTVVRAMSPIIIVFAATPMLVLVPILVMWTSFAPWTRTFAVAMQTVPIILLNTITGFTNVPFEKEELAMVYGASRVQRFLKIVLPQALPRIFTGLRMGVINATMGIVGTEFIVLGRGMGYRIIVACNFLKFPLVFGCIIVIALASYILMCIVTMIERNVVVWKH